MEGLKRCIGLAAVALMFAAVILPEVAAVRYRVGGDGMGDWRPNNKNLTVWAQGKHFYNGDWLYFVYDRNQMNVLEVNETDYGNCISDHSLHNWTTGAGRDVVPLNVTKTYYFISGNGYCFSGVKLKIDVENSPPPPSFPPAKSGGSPSNLLSTFRAQVVVPALFAVGAVWDSFVLLL